MASNLVNSLELINLPPKLAYLGLSNNYSLIYTYNLCFRWETIIIHKRFHNTP